jgi:hypothetical protein
MTGAGIASTPAGPLPLGQLRAVFRDLLVGYRQAVSAFGQHEATFRIGGQQVQMRSAGAAPLAVLEAALEHLRRPASTPADVAICVFAGGPAHAFSALPPPGVYVALRSGLQMTVTAQPAAVTAYDPRVRLGIVWLAGDPWAHVRAYAAPLREVLAAAMRPQGLMGLHAAAVGNEHGGALLAGMHFAGEDFCLVRSAPGPESAPLAFSLYGSAKLAPSSLAWLQPPFAAATGRSIDGKLVYLLHRAPGLQVVEQLPLRAVLVLQITGAGPSRLCATTPVAAINALAPTSVRLMGLPAQAAAAVFHSAATLVRQVRCYRLELGADVMATPALVAAAIRGEAAHAC